MVGVNIRSGGQQWSCPDFGFLLGTCAKRQTYPQEQDAKPTRMEVWNKTSQSLHRCLFHLAEKWFPKSGKHTDSAMPLPVLCAN
jgi:hypothetical protein